MLLKQTYKPVEKDLNRVEDILKTFLNESRDDSILKVNRFLLESPGKRLRPALVILSSKATGELTSYKHLLNLASALELIHTASLIHDDIIDHSLKRHNKETINKKFGQDTAIAFGDYLYSKAFDLIASINRPDILGCITKATHKMCEGELIQVTQRDNLNLNKNQYIIIVKKKTASLIASCCQAGTMLVNNNSVIINALKDYGLNFGIAFQIIDDCLDLVGKEESIGKSPGQDIKVGELTLPLLNLLNSAQEKERQELKKQLLTQQYSLDRIKIKLLDSGALSKTKDIARAYLEKAKAKLKPLSESKFKNGLLDLADFVIESRI